MYIDELKEKIKKDPKRIILPEGTDPRTRKAASVLVKEKLVEELYLVGNEGEIHKKAGVEGVDLSGVHIVDPNAYEAIDTFAEEYYNLRKHKGVSEEEAQDKVKKVLPFGALFVRLGHADGMVAGAANTTADVSRSAITIVRTARGIRFVSSCFVIVSEKKELGEKGLFIFADCGLIPDPTAEQLCDIAIASAQNARKLCNIEPRVALLSFSTRGSAKHRILEKVIAAKGLLDNTNADFVYDGELQLDAAIVPEVSGIKCPSSPLKGSANVLIFPDLNAGNICYKIIERFADAHAYGPIYQGLSKPVNDLSRGSSWEDIVDTVAITSLQAE
ncbi:phosphate acetyltransferase [Spirochaetota bacterium]